MPQTSTIKEIRGVKPWEGTHGRVYYFSLEMANGDKGEIGKKSETALKVGDSLTYDIEVTGKGNNLREIKQNGFTGNGHHLAGPRSSAMALAYAKDLAVANIQVAGKPLEMTPALAEKITSVANIFNDWLKQHE
jgi:hypothetical protein